MKNIQGLKRAWYQNTESKHPLNMQEPFRGKENTLVNPNKHKTTRRRERTSVANGSFTNLSSLPSSGKRGGALGDTWGPFQGATVAQCSPSCSICAKQEIYNVSHAVLPRC